jgi:hypothetical protein
MSYQEEQLKLELQVLQRAKRLVRKGWCAGYEARDSQDVDCFADSVIACKWCATGSITRATTEIVGVSGEGHPVAGLLIEELETALHDAGEAVYELPGWNDIEGRTADDVVGLMTKVERRLRGLLPVTKRTRKSRKIKGQTAKDVVGRMTKTKKVKKRSK